jgi:metal-dependent amidase/aminoacylase/carboxypeptidase family protein
MGIPGAYAYPGISASASEDFAVIADKIPSTFMYLSAGFPDDRGEAPAHNPKVMFNEDVCPIGAACYAHCAAQWLKDNR